MNRFNPGCCCGCTKDYADEFNRADNSNVGVDWTEDSGTWDIVSNQLVCSGVGRIRNTSYTDGDGILTIIALIELPTVGDIARVLVGYTDSNNYAYVSYERMSTHSGGDIQMKVVQVQGGTSTVKRTDDYTGGMFTGSLRAKVCWHGPLKRLAGEFTVNVTFDLNEIFAYTQYQNLTGTYGSGHGLQVANMAGSAIRFDYYRIYTIGSFESPFRGDCPYCILNCAACIDGITAPVYRLVFNGTGFDGTYLVTMQGPDYCVQSFTGAGGQQFELLFMNFFGTRLIRVYSTPFGPYCWGANSLTDFDCLHLSSVSMTPINGAGFAPCSSGAGYDAASTPGTVSITAIL